VAAELLHTYSLIHDDLPCMDDDATRRGRPSVHVVFGYATAVLAGDALQAAAYEQVLSADAPAERVRLAARDLARACGSLRLVGGQADDLAFDATAADADAVESIHARKSAALISAAIVGGARLAGADESLLARLARFGERVGVAFQIADDVLDEDDGDLCSLVVVAGREAARARAEALLASGLSELELLGGSAGPLRELARFAVWRVE
jgi:geranylgeranyl pyrophosphate synthase